MKKRQGDLTRWKRLSLTLQLMSLLKKNQKKRPNHQHQKNAGDQRAAVINRRSLKNPHLHQLSLK